MAIAFQSIGAVATGNGVTSLASNAPSGVTSGDLLILCVSTASTVATITTPTGWTQIQNASDANAAERTAMYRRIADGGSNDTPTVSFGSSTDAKSFIVRINGQHASTPFDTSNVATAVTGATRALPTITTAEDNELCIACAGFNGSNITSDPSTWTQRGLSNPGAGINTSLGVWTKAAATAGSYGGETAGIQFSFDGSCTIIAAFKQAAGAAGPPISKLFNFSNPSVLDNF